MIIQFICFFSILSNGYAEAPLFSRGLHSVTTDDIGQVPLESAHCGKCHTEIWNQWQQSAHANAWKNNVFQVSWRPWPNAWCLNCHAPLSSAQADIAGDRASLPGAILYDFNQPAPESLANEGINCVTCHVRNSKILTSTPPSIVTNMVHEASWEPQLQRPEFCGGCHEFPFQNHTPMAPFSYGTEPLQSTLTEWAQSSAAANGVTCQNCHMPSGHHTWPGGHDQSLLQRTLAVSVEPDSHFARVKIVATNAAHRVPTGDPFHRIVLQLCSDKNCSQQVGRISLNRTFQRTETTWTQIADTTIPPAIEGPSSSRFFDVPIDGELNYWRLWYYFSDPRLDSSLNDSERRMLILEEKL